MEGEKKTQPVLHKQAREKVFSVYQYFKLERDHGGPLLSVANCEQRTADAFNVSLRTMQRIVKEAKSSEEEKGEVQFHSPGKTWQRNKPVTGLDEFDRSLLRRKVLEFYNKGQFPTAKKLVQEMKQAMGFAGSQSSMLRILKSLGFKYRKSNDGRKFLMERNDIAAARTVFLRTMHDLGNSTEDRTVYYLDETWLNQNHTNAYCWQNADSSGGFRVPTGKGERLIICHAGSAKTGFVPLAPIFSIPCNTRIIVESRLFANQSKNPYSRGRIGCDSRIRHPDFDPWVIHPISAYNSRIALVAIGDPVKQYRRLRQVRFVCC